jgi:hypothetical protein
MADDGEPLMAESPHDLGQRHCHCPLWHGSVIVRIGRARTLAVSREVSGDDGEISREQLPHLAPHQRGLWKPVEQQQGRSSQRAPMHEDLTCVGRDYSALEAEKV